MLLNSEHDSTDNQKVRNMVTDAAYTQTTRATNGIVLPFIVENKGTSKSRSAEKPLGCITAATYHALLSPEALSSFLTYNRKQNPSDIKNPINTIATVEQLSLITQGKIPKLEDCFYRMLLPHEVKLGMAFDADYVVKGNSKEQVKQCGNAVTPPVMKDLVQRCVETLK
jgi:DNA (cytosine-5)-methyltransferase 1